jgi:iron(III) transport system ATP-binding protein
MSEPALADPAAPGVDIVGAHKRFGSKVALDSVDLPVPPGSFCVLLGPSGSGKTTLLRCVAGIERLTSGQVRIDGRLVADGAAHRPPEQRDLAMVFQDYALWPHLTAARNVAFALGRRGLARREATARAVKMLERVGLAQLAERYPNEMSGGEQQRVALARALVAGTGLLLFDEPLSNLDADLRERMRLEISTLARDSGATSLYITHDQAEAFALADLIGVLHEGKLVQLGAPEEIYQHPATPFVARFTGLAGELPVVVTGPPDVWAEPHRRPGKQDAHGMTGAWARGRGGDLGPRSRRFATVRAAQGTGEGCAEIAATLPDQGLRGRMATALIRPAGVQLAPPDHPDRHLEGLVLDTAYRGRGYDHAVLVGGGVQLVGIHDERRWERGARVAVRLAPSACLLFDQAPEPAGVGAPAPGQP